MELTVLGRYAPYAPAGGCGPGYLVRSGSVSLLLDGGPGTLARLQQVMDLADLTAVLVSHIHEDHISDLHSLGFAVADVQKAGRRKEPLPIYAPLEPADVRRWMEPATPGTTVLLPLPAETGISFGAVACTFCRTDHPRPNWAVRVADESGSLVYTGDTGTGIDLATFARGAGMLLVEATYTEALGGERHVHRHLIAAEAAELGRRAGVRRLLLTHFRPTLDPGQLLAEARAVFPSAEVVEELGRYCL